MTPGIPVTTRRFDAGEVSLAVHAWGESDPDGDARPILLAHATGFHGMVWRPVAERLVQAGYGVWSLDFRGHGDSDAPDIEYAWDGFAADVLAVVDHLGLGLRDDLVGVGHSKGSAALALAEAERSGTFERLWLYEPIIFPGEPPPGPSPENSLSEGARRRRMIWDSPEQAYENFASKPPLDALGPEALRAYVDHGLRPRDDGSWELKCSGEIEARVYAMGSAHDAYRRLHAVFCPARIVCGERTDAIRAEFGEMLVERLPAGSFELGEGLGHFGPLQDPGAAVASIERFLVP